MKKITALLLAVACQVANAEAPQQTILECDGELWGDGISAPKDAVIPSREPNAAETYTIKGNTLTESGGGSFADQDYALCSTTSTNYVFSNDCSVARQQYIMDWLESTAADPTDPRTSPIAKKHPKSIWGWQTVIVDRVNLRVDEEQLMGHTRFHYDNKSKKMVFAPFLVSIRYSGACKRAKPKI